MTHLELMQRANAINAAEKKLAEVLDGIKKLQYKLGEMPKLADNPAFSVAVEMADCSLRFAYEQVSTVRSKSNLGIMK